MRSLMLLLFITVFMAGCAATSDSEREAKRLGVPYTLKSMPAKPMPEQYIAPIMALDEKLTWSIYYVRHDQQRFPSGQVRVVINLYNAQPSKEVWVDWKVLYYGEDNYLIEQTEWESTRIPSQVIQTIRSNSMRPDVMNFTMIVKSSPRTDPQLTKPLGFVREYEEQKAEAEAKRQEELARQQAANAQKGSSAVSSTAQGIGQVNQTIQQMNQGIQSTGQAIQSTDQLIKTIKAIGVLQ